MSLISLSQNFRCVGISGSPIPFSTRSRILLLRALDGLSRAGAATPALIELALLPPEGLLGRRKDPVIEVTIKSIQEAQIVVVATPAHRGSYGGLLRVYFDLLRDGALEGKVALPILHGSGAGFLPSLQHPLQPLLASLGALVVPEGVFGTDDQFVNGSPAAALVASLDRATVSALALAGAMFPRVANASGPLHRETRVAARSTLKVPDSQARVE
jgi:FMN reductase